MKKVKSVTLLRKAVLTLSLLLLSYCGFSAEYSTVEKPWKRVYIYGVKNEKGKVIIPPKHRSITLNKNNYSLAEDYLPSKKEWFFTVFDDKGKKVLKGKNVDELAFYFGFFAVTDLKSNTISVYDANIKKLNIKIPSNKKPAFFKDFCVVFTDERNGSIYNKDGNLISSFDNYLLLENRNNSQSKGFAYKHNGKWGLYQYNNNAITTPEFDAIVKANGYCFDNENNYVVRKGDKMGYFDMLAKQQIPVKYDTILPYLSNKYIGIYPHGFDVLSGQSVLYSFDKFDEAQLLHKGEKSFVVYQKKGKSGLMDLESKELIPAQFDSIGFGPFNPQTNQITFITYDKKTGLKELYNASGKALPVPAYDDLSILNDSVALIRKGQLWGVLINWKPVLPCSYNDITMETSSGSKSLILKLNQNYKWGLMNMVSLDTTGCVFNSIKSFGSFKSTGQVWIVQTGKESDFFFEKGFASAGVPFSRIVNNKDDAKEIVLLNYAASKDFTYFNLETKSILPLIEKVIYPFKNGFARVSVLNRINSIDKSFRPVSIENEYAGDNNCLIVWVHQGVSSYLDISKSNKLTVTVENQFGQILFTKEIAGGTTKDLENCYPEDEQSDGFAKFTLPKGNYKIHVRSKKEKGGIPGSEWRFDVKFDGEISRRMIQLSPNT